MSKVNDMGGCFSLLFITLIVSGCNQIFSVVSLCCISGLKTFISGLSLKRRTKTEKCNNSLQFRPSVHRLGFFTGPRGYSDLISHIGADGLSDSSVSCHRTHSGPHSGTVVGTLQRTDRYQSIRKLCWRLTTARLWGILGLAAECMHSFF